MSEFKPIGRAFGRIYEQVAIIRERVARLDDPEAWELVEALDVAIVAHIRRLRLYLEIPYEID